MESLWRKETGEIKFCKSQGKSAADYARSKYDVIVIGAGMAGILIAYYLQEAGKKVLVLEARTIASGQTEGTTAKITSQHGLKYSQLLNTVGLEKAKLYAQANEGAIGEYERLIREKKIDCQFQRTTSFLYATEDERPLKEEVRVANLLGIDAYYTEETELPFDVLGAVGFRNQAQFQPLEFLQALCEELTVLENIQVQKISGHEVLTVQGNFWAEKIVVATHYPIINIPGFYFLRQHQERMEQVLLWLISLRARIRRHSSNFFITKPAVTVLRNLPMNMLMNIWVPCRMTMQTRLSSNRMNGAGGKMLISQVIRRRSVGHISLRMRGISMMDLAASRAV